MRLVSPINRKYKRGRLVDGELVIDVNFLSSKIPGALSLVVSYYLPANGSKWYEGSKLYNSS